MVRHHVRYSRIDAKWYNLDQAATTNYPTVRRNYPTTEDNEPPPEIEYNYLSRTRQDYPCDGENKYRCEKAIKERRVVDCSISRFRYIFNIIITQKYNPGVHKIKKTVQNPRIQVVICQQAPKM